MARWVGLRSRVLGPVAFIVAFCVLFALLDLGSDGVASSSRALLHRRAARVVIAVHRGLRSSYRGRVPDEDSVRACLSAIASGADACEVDVRTSSDGVPLLMHDGTTARLMGRAGCDLVVAATTYQQLSRCRLPHGDALSRLSDLATAMRPYAGSHSLVVELKGPVVAQVDLFRINQLLAGSGFTGARRNLVYESFYRSNLVRMRQISPRTPALLISFHAPDATTVAGTDGLNGLILPYAELVRALGADPTYVEDFRDHAMQVMPWQVNSPEQLRYVLAADVTGLLTDDLATLQAALDLRRPLT